MAVYAPDLGVHPDKVEGCPMARAVPVVRSVFDASRSDLVDVWWAVIERKDVGWERLVFAARALRDARAAWDATHLP